VLQLSCRPVEMASSNEEDPEQPNMGEKRKRPLEEWLEDQSNRLNEQDEEDAIKLMSIKLLSEKEKKVEAFMHSFLESFQKKHGTELGFSADLSFQDKIVQAEKKMNEVSMILAHKYQPIIKELFIQEEMKNMEDQYGIIKAEVPIDEDWSANYKECFLNFINDEENVSFQTNNKDLLKNISIRDYFTLVFWAMNTCKRQAGDNLLQLIVCGKSSCGKSVIFENPIQQISHNMTTDPGVGRFLTKSKSTLLLHDCNIEILVKGKDVDKLKSITRTEPINVKTHSKTQPIFPLYVMVTSNKHLYVHRFKKAKIEGFCSRSLYKSDVQPSKTVHEMDIDAVKNRYIECFVRDRPDLSPGILPTSGNFTRIHLIRGLFTHIIGILMKYKRDDFLSDYLFLYAFIGLCKNIHLVDNENRNYIEHVIVKLIVNKYGLSQDQQMQCFKCLQEKKVDSVKQEEIN